MGIRYFLVLGAVSLICLPLAAGLSAEEPATARGGYSELVELFEEWRVFQQPQMRNGVPDYTSAAMAAQLNALRDYQKRLNAIDISAWPVAEAIDWWLVWAEMNGLDFDHRVLRPWARDPAFYSMLIDAESDTPLKEGPVISGAIESWRLSLPLEGSEIGQFKARLEAIPGILDQAKGNLVGDARDLWALGIRSQQGQSAMMADLAKTVGQHHPEMLPTAERARQAVEVFVSWLTDQLPSKRGSSGIGVENYTWYLQNVHLVPLTWEDELRLMQRELARSVAHMKLEEHQNRALPTLDPPLDAAGWARRNEAATVEFLRFLEESEALEVEDFFEPALRERLQPYSTPEDSHFFAQVNLRDPRVLHCHFIHWIEKAYLRHHPHPSPIRQATSLYNIWDSRSEGLATGMEEMMMSAGMFADSPRSRELVYIMVAMRAARAIAGLRVQSNEWTVDEAVLFATGQTPRGWFRSDGDLVVFEQQLYLRQPGYGTSYITGKALIDHLMAERSQQLGDSFSLKGFMTELFGAGMIPVSLGRWEIAGADDWLPTPD